MASVGVRLNAQLGAAFFPLVLRLLGLFEVTLIVCKPIGDAGASPAG